MSVILWAPSLAAQEFVCFVYHRFGDARYPSTNIDIDTFREQLNLLQDRGIAVLTLGVAMQRLTAGELSGPTAVLTVDDGYESFLTGAWPVLEEFGMPATLFITTDMVGGGDMLDWGQLRNLAAQGIEIGNHTSSHAYFLDLPDSVRQRAFRHDVQTAQAQFVEHLGVAPKLFSYPYGEHDAGMQTEIQQLGFDAAVAQQSGVVSAEAHRYGLPRFPMGGPYATLAGFASKAGMKALPVIAQQAGPQSLRVAVRPDSVRLEAAQCFVAGQTDCTVEVTDVADTTWIRLSTTRPITSRRTLFTITAPARHTGAWHWFSHVWVRPQGFP